MIGPLVPLMAIAGAAAQPTAASGRQEIAASSQEIVIHGRRLPDAEVIKQFVGRVATPVGGQLGVFRGSICPNVLGMADADAAKVLARMRAVSRAAKVLMAGGGCQPNLTLIVAADGRAFMHDVALTRPESLKSLTPAQRERLLTDPGPAWAWRVIGELTEDGNSNAANDPALIMGGGSLGGSMTGMHTRGGSIIKLQVRQDVSDAYVVIDEKALDGVSAVQLADYTMMRAVAGAYPAVPRDADGSILSLFRPGVERAASLSYLDLAFLTTVYELPMDLPFNRQVDLIASRINGYSSAAKARESLQEKAR